MNVHNIHNFFYVIRNNFHVCELNSCEIDGYGEIISVCICAYMCLCALTQSNLNGYENEICWFFFLSSMIFLMRIVHNFEEK